MSGERTKKGRVKGAVDILRREQFEQLDRETRVALIQQLIPIGLMAAAEELQREIAELAGPRHGRKEEGEVRRFGSNPGTVRLGGQRIPIRVPRVRAGGKEVQLRSYELLQRDVQANESLLHRVLYGLSCRDYEKTMPAFKGGIGRAKSSVSRAFIRGSEERRQELEKRRLSGLDIVAIVLDGKYFAKDAMVVALGIDIQGHKHVLGAVQTDTENDVVVTEFLRNLREVRGLDISKGVLVVSDGSKGFRSGLQKAFRGYVVHQRCQWHKRENIISYLSKAEQKGMKTRLQAAYERPTYKEANDALKKIQQELDDRNQSASSSLAEGYEETLALHRLGVFALVGASLKTTNLIESVNSMLEDKCGKVDRWSNSAQKHRWLAAALLDIEPRLRRLKGYQQLPKLREAIKRELKLANSPNVVHERETEGA